MQCLVEQIKSIPNNQELKDDSIYLGSYNLKEIKENFIVIAQPPENIINTYKFGYEADNPSFQFLRYNIYNEPSAGSINETFYTLNLENAKQFFKTNIRLYYIYGVAMHINIFNDAARCADRVSKLPGARCCASSIGWGRQ